MFLAQFEKGLLVGDKRIIPSIAMTVTHFLGSVEYINGDILLHSVMPKDSVHEIKTVQVDGKDTESIMLNGKQEFGF